MKDLRSHLQLCLVTKIQLEQSFDEYSAVIEKAILGGVTMLQLREKHNNLSLVKQRALALKRLLKPYRVPLIINDFVGLAKEVEADGVHIGQGDMSPIEARGILGHNKIIGISIETIDELQRSNEMDVIDYVSISAVYPSKTKSNYKTIWGLDGLAEAIKISRHPIIAIGGIRLENASEIVKAGVDGIAILGAIYDAYDPLQVAKDLKKIF